MGLFSDLFGTTSKSSSSTTSTTLTNIATEVTQTTIQNCVASANQSQRVNFVSRGDMHINNTKINMMSTIDLKCLLKSEVQNKIASNVANAIVQQVSAQAQMSPVFGTESTSTAVSLIVTNISNKLTTEQIQSSIAETMQTQDVNVIAGGNQYVNNVSIEMSSKIIAESIMKTGAYSGIINDIANKLDQNATSKSTAFDFGSIFKNLSGIVMMFMFLIFMLIVGAGYVIYNIV